MKIRFRSILERIIWLHVLALGAVFGGVSIAAWFLLRATANDLQEHVLLDHAANVAVESNQRFILTFGDTSAYY